MTYAYNHFYALPKIQNLTYSQGKCILRDSFNLRLKKIEQFVSSNMVGKYWSCLEQIDFSEIWHWTNTVARNNVVQKYIANVARNNRIEKCIT